MNRLIFDLIENNDEVLIGNGQIVVLKVTLIHIFLGKKIAIRDRLYLV